MTDTATYRVSIADNHLAELFREFPAVMVPGPRVVGKTTIAAQLVDEIVYLDEPGSAPSFRVDPDAAIHRAERASPSLMGSQTHSPQISPGHPLNDESAPKIGGTIEVSSGVVTKATMTEVQSGRTMILSYLYTHLNSAPRIVIPTIANVAG